MTDSSLRYHVETCVALFAFVAVLVTYALELWVPFVILVALIFLYGAISSAERQEADARAWEDRYAAMNDTQKIDYHLDRARRYYSNVDANIAQALIEKGK